jgi:hypothetical protein
MARHKIAATALAKGAAAAFILAQLPAQAGQATASLQVAVTLQVGAPPEFGACKAGEVVQTPLGVTATVSCTPLQPAPAPQKPSAVVSSVLFHIQRGSWLGIADETMGLGTVTSWRVIRLADRDYLEMMVGW